jgi:hypothetical protein
VKPSRVACLSLAITLSAFAASAADTGTETATVPATQVDTHAIKPFAAPSKPVPLSETEIKTNAAMMKAFQDPSNGAGLGAATNALAVDAKGNQSNAKAAASAASKASTTGTNAKNTPLGLTSKETLMSTHDLNINDAKPK